MKKILIFYFKEIEAKKKTNKKKVQILALSRKNTIWSSLHQNQIFEIGKILLHTYYCDNKPEDQPQTNDILPNELLQILECDKTMSLIRRDVIKSNAQ